MFPDGGMPTPANGRAGEPMYFPGKPACQPEAAMSKRVQSYWRKAEEAEVQTINQGSRSNGWFMNQESTSPVLGSSSEPPTRSQATPFPD